MNILDQIAEDAERAMAKIGNDPDRLHELGDNDLTALALKVKTVRPLAEQALIEQCGGVDEANAVLARLKTFKQPRLVRLVAAAQRAVRMRHMLTQYQLAALVIDAQVGANFVMVEQERRQAVKARAVN